MEGYWDMSTKHTIKILARKFRKLMPSDTIKVLVKNYPVNEFDNVLFIPEELTKKYGIKTDN